MQNIHDNFRKFLAEGTYREPDRTKILREIEEDELEHIRRAIDEMGPEDLAFNELFDGKNRILIPLSVADVKSELGQFIKVLTHPDWVYSPAEKDPWIAEFESGQMVRTDPRPGAKRKKESMKIGKWLSNTERVIKAALAWYAAKEYSDADLKKWEEKTVPNLIKLLGTQAPGRISARFGVGNMREIPEKIVQLRQYWQQHADYIKKNPEGIKDHNTYSIVITRHPIDVLRMSDFDDITSCHTPPSRKGDSDIAYYKCAVAEAHGHGAIAYVVKNEDLEEAYETPDLKELANASDFQEGEVFWDEQRSEGFVEPVSRLRLRQVRHYKDGAYDSGRSRFGGRFRRGGTQFAIPERRVYGKKIPGFREAVVNWARENQSEAAATVPHHEHRPINLDYFVKFGGSYEDNNIDTLVTDFFQAEGTMGSVVQDTETEDQLDVNLVGGAGERLEAAAQIVFDQITLNHFKVDFDVEVGDEYAWIEADVRLRLEWDESEWSSLPDYRVMHELPHHYEDYGHPYNSIDDCTVNKVGSEIVVHLRVNTAKYTSDTGQFYTADDFEEFLGELDEMEYTGGAVDVFRELTEQYMKREGAMEGGALINLGYEVLNRDFTSYIWDLEATEGYELDEFELISATTLIEISYENTTLEVAEKILGSREYWLELRRQMHIKPQEHAGEEYYVDVERFGGKGTDYKNVDASEKAMLYRLNYHVGDDAPDGQVEVFKELLEFWNDEDDLMAKVQEVFDSFVKKAGTLKQVEPTMDINENKRVSGQKLFNNWRQFLNA